jgi:cysteinyl-tRNA synthetase
MIVEARDHGEDPADPRKEDPLDFVLWKPSQPGESSWPSPWGEGRPGWHIECSAMAVRYLGPALDVHGGGTDLVYPHHENEIAQSVAATGESPFARYWVHVGMARLGGTKMSKSLGNLVLVRDLRQQYDPLVVRHYLLRTHYRDYLDYSEDELRASIEPVERLRQALARNNARIVESRLADVSRRFDAALADDLNTPAALDVLDEAAGLALAAPAAGGEASPAAPLREMATRLGLTQ